MGLAKIAISTFSRRKSFFCRLNAHWALELFVALLSTYFFEGFCALRVKFLIDGGDGKGGFDGVHVTSQIACALSSDRESVGGAVN